MTNENDYISKVANLLGLSLETLHITEVNLDKGISRDLIHSVRKSYKDRHEIRIISDLDFNTKRRVLVKELLHIAQQPYGFSLAADHSKLLALADLVIASLDPPIDLAITALVVPEKKVAEGTLIECTSLAWASVVARLGKNWEEAFSIPPHAWEEIIAGAYKEAGFDEVTLTHRSGDHGRDVVAVKKGIGCIKIIDSVKAYKKSHLVSYDDVRALLGVLAGERDASKAVISTTSDFPPNIMKDPFIAPFVPYRLELMNGDRLRTWLTSLAR